MTATGFPRPKWSNWTAELGSFVGKPFMTRPSGYSLPSYPSFVLIALANKDEAVQK
jgi:hypothetical protein